MSRTESLVRREVNEIVTNCDVVHDLNLPLSMCHVNDGIGHKCDRRALDREEAQLLQPSLVRGGSPPSH